MNLKNRAWKYVTAIVVVFVIANPEMFHLAVFVDAVGLDIFLMLLEVQALAILGAMLNKKTALLLGYIKYFHIPRFKKISCQQAKQVLLAFAAPTPAGLMHLLVFSAATGVALNAC